MTKKKKAKTPVRSSGTAIKTKRTGTTMSTQEAESSENNHNFLTSSLNNKNTIARAKFTQRKRIDLGSKAKSSSDLHGVGSARKTTPSATSTKKKTGT